MLGTISFSHALAGEEVDRRNKPPLHILLYCVEERPARSRARLGLPPSNLQSMASYTNVREDLATHLLGLLKISEGKKPLLEPWKRS